MMEVKEIYALIAEGEDGFAAMLTQKGPVPLVFADYTKLKRYESTIAEIAKLTGKKCYVVKFSSAEILKVIE